MLEGTDQAVAPLLARDLPAKPDPRQRIQISEPFACMRAAGEGRCGCRVVGSVGGFQKCVAYFAATDASSEAGDICMPTPGWMTITEARPTTSARMVRA